MKNFLLLLAVSVLVVLSGCAAPLPKADQASQLQAKSFTPKAGLSNIYVYRPSNFGGGAVDYRVTMDKQLAGDLDNGSYVLIEVSPGRHTVSTSAIGRSDVAGDEVLLETKAGNNYFFLHKAGFFGAQLRQVDEATGKREVAKYNMVSAPDNVVKPVATATNQPTVSYVAKPAKAPTERLVLMPLRVGEEDKRLQGAMETALVQGLQQNYIVFAGEQVAQKAREIFLKESRNIAKKECDETRCMQGIAEAFQAELIATANVTKQDGGYFLALSIQNIFDNKVVYSNSIPCRNCDSFQVVDKLKELSFPSH